MPRFRARLGVLVSPNILLYGTGGVAFGEVSGAFSYAATNCYVLNVTGPAVTSPCTPTFTTMTYTANAVGSWNETRVGWTAGGGVEFALWGPWKARAEYRFTDLGSFTRSVPLARTCTDGPSTGGASTCSSTPNVGSTAAIIDIASSFQTIRVGIGFDF